MATTWRWMTRLVDPVLDVEDPIAEGERYRVRDLLTGTVYDWQGPWNYVRLDPAGIPAHIFLVERVRSV